jgi:hypothetical protein
MALRIMLEVVGSSFGAAEPKCSGVVGSYARSLHGNPKLPELHLAGTDILAFKTVMASECC